MKEASKVQLGKAIGDGAGLAVLPLELVTQSTAIVGRRGSGKTNTAVVCTEDLLEAGQQVVILDPLDVWWGLKSSKTGASAGYPVLVFGDPSIEHHDLPLGKGEAEAVADFVVEERVPCILSMRHLRKGEQREVVWRFCERLYYRKGQAAHRTPLLVVIDEASTFAPQRVSGDEARMLGAIEDLQRRGRTSGIGVMLIDQRPASVAKDVLTQTELLIAHQVTSPHDRKALEEWIRAHDTADQGDTFMESLASLRVGEAWVWSPSWLDCFTRVKVRERRTFDSSRTPKAGERVSEPRRLAAIDLEVVKGRLSEAVERAKANDPRNLRERIVKLEGELATAQHAALRPAVDPQAVDEAVAKAVAARDREWSRVMTERDNQWRERVVEAASARLQELRVDLAESVKALGTSEAVDEVRRSLGMPERVKPRRLVREFETVMGVAAARQHPAGSIEVRGELTGPERKVVEACAFWLACGVEDPSREQVAAVAGYHGRTKGFLNALGSLRSAGLIEEHRLTEAGRALVTTPATPTLADLHERLKGVMESVEVRVFELVHAEGGRIDRERLAEALGYHPRTKGLLNALGRMRGTLGVIDYRGGDVVGTELMYPPTLMGGGR